MEFDKTYQKLWVVLNGIIFIYGIILFIYATCCNNKKKNIISVKIYFIYTFINIE